ncbi:hypothetical protein AWV79_10405 [Cupriavidus sp. UYMMa02A]|nr:hypothetical protein AWV79_10405 [Cupriavidus sp. UYMMa02A]
MDGLMFPAGVPRRASTRCRAKSRTSCACPRSRKDEDLNLVPVGNSPEAFAAVMKSDQDKWSRIIRDVGITME